MAIYANSSKDFAFFGLNEFGRFPTMIPVIGSICFGALLGDIVESFFKRRVGRKRGENWIPFDQLDFILGVLFFSFVVAGLMHILGFSDENWFFESFSIWHILILLVLTPFFHLFANFVNKRFISKN